MTVAPDGRFTVTVQPVTVTGPGLLMVNRPRYPVRPSGPAPPTVAYAAVNAAGAGNEDARDADGRAVWVPETVAPAALAAAGSPEPVASGPVPVGFGTGCPPDGGGSASGP